MTLRPAGLELPSHAAFRLESVEGGVQRAAGESTSRLRLEFTGDRQSVGIRTGAQDGQQNELLELAKRLERRHGRVYFVDYEAVPWQPAGQRSGLAGRV